MNWGWEKRYPGPEDSTELGPVQGFVRSRPFFSTFVLVFVRLLTSC